jgi:hypothetical protein
MKNIIGLSLAAITVLSTTFLSISSALGDTLCLEAGHYTSECPAAQRYSGDIKGKTPAGAALLLENGKTIEDCDSDIVGLGSTLTNEAAHKGIKTLVDTGALLLTNCVGLCKTAKNIPPIWWLFDALNLDAFFTPDGAGSLRLRWNNCTFEIECEYQFTNETQLLALSSDTITATAVPLTKVAGFVCPGNKMSLDASWLITKNETSGASIYLAALP